MIALFKQKTPANLVVLLIFGVLIKMPYLLYPQVAPAGPSDGLLYPWLVQVLGVGSGALYAGALAAFVLLYSQAMMINYTVNEHRLTTKASYLPAMAYLLVTSLLPEWNYFSPPLLASTLVIWVVLKMFRVYNLPSVKGRVYNAGLIVGICSLIHFPSVLFLVLLLLGVLILRPFRLNELVLLVLGAATPYYFYAVYLFLADQLTLHAVFPPLSVGLPDVGRSARLAVVAAFLIVPFIIGSYQIQLHLRKMLIQVRKNWSLVLIWLVLALIVPFANRQPEWYSWVLALPPLAAFHAAAYLYPARRWLPLLLFWGTLAFVLAQQYGLIHWKG